MILSFNPQFIPLILSGSKIHTIRKDEHDRWRPGMKIQFATGIRTKDYNQFMTDICKSVQYIWICWDRGVPEVHIGNTQDQLMPFYIPKHYGIDQMKELFANDGFKRQPEFFKWFWDAGEKTDPIYDKTFSGKIIHWTNKRY